MVKHVAANALTLLIVALIGLGVLVAWGQAQYAGPGDLAEEAIFEVRPGERLRSVSNRLEAEGIISDATIFRIAARYTGDDQNLKFGEYRIPATASMQEVMGIITSGRALAYTVTIPEGWTSWQVVERLRAEENLSGEIAEIPPEGSLAPDTYDFMRGSDRMDLIRRMTEAQNRIIAAAWEARAPDLPLSSMDEALILASIVEKETGVAAEREKVASVFVNRLRRGMRLQTDPTVIYGITRGEGSLGRGLRQSELRANTPWNTYVIDGLPPTPIANPGRASIIATLNPADTPFYYFVADGTGGHAFATTLAEHNANVRVWRRIEAERAAQRGAEGGSEASSD